MRSHRKFWILRNTVTGACRPAIYPDCENGLLSIHLAGGRDYLADYEASDRPLPRASNRERDPKKSKRAASSKPN